MANLEFRLKAKVDGVEYQSDVIPFFTLPVVVPPVVIPPPVGDKKWVMVNVIEWSAAGLANLPTADSSECSYFVLPVMANGALIGGNDTKEKNFVAAVKAAGKLPTFSVAGGIQSVADITAAVTVNRNGFLNAIATHLIQYGFGGIWIDIEGTKIDAQAMADFLLALRVKFDSIRPGLTIGVYTQGYQKETVWAKLSLAADAIDKISTMIYDYEYTLDELKSQTLAWLPKVKNQRSKLLAGLAVNYTTGLTAEQYANVLDWVNAENLGGVGLWNNVLFEDAWKRVQRQKFPNIF